LGFIIFIFYQPSIIFQHRCVTHLCV